eukprot:3300853-Pleurochrysis_carterae.AAC.1
MTQISSSRAMFESCTIRKAAKDHRGQSQPLTKSTAAAPLVAAAVCQSWKQGAAEACGLMRITAYGHYKGTSSGLLCSLFDQAWVDAYSATRSRGSGFSCVRRSWLLWKTLSCADRLRPCQGLSPL